MQHVRFRWNASSHRCYENQIFRKSRIRVLHKQLPDSCGTFGPCIIYYTRGVNRNKWTPHYYYIFFGQKCVWQLILRPHLRVLFIYYYIIVKYKRCVLGQFTFFMKRRIIFFVYLLYFFRFFFKFFFYIRIWFRVLYFFKDSVDIYVQCTMYIELVPVGIGYNDRFFFLGLIALHIQSGYNLINVAKTSSVTTLYAWVNRINAIHVRI